MSVNAKGKEKVTWLCGSSRKAIKYGFSRRVIKYGSSRRVIKYGFSRRVIKYGSSRRVIFCLYIAKVDFKVQDG